MWFKALKQIFFFFSFFFAATREVFREPGEAHVFQNQQLWVFVDLSVCVLSRCEAVTLWLIIFTKSLFPLPNDLFGLTQMTHLVWRNILVTWLQAFRHLLLWIKSTQQEIAGVVCKNANLNSAQMHTVTSFVRLVTVAMFCLMKHVKDFFFNF